MLSSALTIYVDTNCFLHLRDLKDLPWREIFDANELNLAVSPPVIRELDRFKEDTGNGRRRDRARQALRQIDSAAEAEDVGLLLRERDPLVRLQIPRLSRIDWDKYPELDPTSADDHLVSAARSDPEGNAVAVLSVDTGPRIKARRMGLRAPTPPDTWRLPDPVEDPIKELAKVTRQLEQLRATRPSLEVDFAGADPDGPLVHLVPTLSPLTQEVRDRLSAVMRRRFPREEVLATRQFPLEIRSFPGEVTTADVAVYEADHASFLMQQERAFEGLHALASYAQLLVPIKLRMKNTSAVTAERLQVRIHEASGAAMVGNRRALQKRHGLVAELAPPKAPTGWTGLPDFELRDDLADRDPTQLYEFEVERGVAWSCAEFRPAQEAEALVWFEARPFPREGAIVAELSATNLPAPIRAELRVSVQKGERAWSDEAILDRLPRWMAEVIRGGSA